jgi:hypothetical protein
MTETPISRVNVKCKGEFVSAPDEWKP